MLELSTAQRAYLRSLANELKPVVQIGKQGLSTQVLDKVDQELTAHELIKVKFQDYKDERRDIAAEIADRLDGNLVAVIGHVAIFYRESSDAEKRQIVLPR
jgi:RNA-binding protein